MARRSKWLIHKTKVKMVPIRDTEFAETLAVLGQLVYDEFSSQPDSSKSTDIPSQPNRYEIASHNKKEGCV